MHLEMRQILVPVGIALMFLQFATDAGAQGSAATPYWNGLWYYDDHAVATPQYDHWRIIEITKNPGNDTVTVRWGTITGKIGDTKPTGKPVFDTPDSSVNYYVQGNKIDREQPSAPGGFRAEDEFEIDTDQVIHHSIIAISDYYSPVPCERPLGFVPVCRELTKRAGDKDTFPNVFRRVPSGLYRRALERAGTADKKKIEDTQTSSHIEIHEIRNYAFVELVFHFSPATRKLSISLLEDDVGKGPIIYKMPVTLGNHASMLLLRDEFIPIMQHQLEALDGVDLKDCTVVGTLRAALSRTAKEPRRSPLLDILVHVPPQAEPTAPASNPPVPHPQPGPRAVVLLSEIFTSGGFRPANGLSLDEWQNLAVVEAFIKFRDSVANSIELARAIKDDDVVGLLNLTGNGFDPVITSLLPKLEEPDGSGQLDSIGRAEVQKIGTLYATVRDQSDYAALDTDVAVALATLALMPLEGIGAALCADIAMKQLYDAVNEYRAAEREEEFARGASIVLGRARHDQSVLKAGAAFDKLIGSLAGVLLSAGGTYFQLGKEVGEAAKTAATVERGYQLVGSIIDADGNVNLAGLVNMSKGDQRAVLAAITDAGLAQESAQALTTEQNQALRALDQLGQQAEAKLEAASQLAKGDAITRDAAIAALKASPPGYLPRFDDPGVRGAIGEAAFLRSQLQNGNPSIDFNELVGRNNAPLIDNISKTHGLVQVKNYADVDSYNKVLQDMLFTTGDAPKQVKAAQEIFENRSVIQEMGAWPSELDPNASEAQIKSWLNDNAKLAVPDDQYAKATANLEKDMTNSPGKYNLPSQDSASYAAAYNKMRQRIIKIGISQAETEAIVNRFKPIH